MLTVKLQNPLRVPQNCQKRVPKLALRERLLPSAKYSSQEAAWTHLLLAQAQSWNGVQHPFLRPPHRLLFHGTQDGLESTMGCFSQSLQNVWAALSNWQPWSYYRNAFYEILVFLFCHESSVSHPLDALLAISSRSWPMPCASTSLFKYFFSTATRLAMRELRSGGWSDAERLGEVVSKVDGFGLRSVEHQWKWWEVIGFNRRVYCWALNLFRVK